MSWTNRAMRNCSPNCLILGFEVVQNDCLGVTSEGLWVDSSAEYRITLTSRGEVRFVSCERSLLVERVQLVDVFPRVAMVAIIAILQVVVFAHVEFSLC